MEMGGEETGSEVLLSESGEDGFLHGAFSSTVRFPLAVAQVKTGR